MNDKNNIITMKIQIHHFYDIIRDFGSDSNIKAHEYGHSYHKADAFAVLLDTLNIDKVIAIGASAGGPPAYYINSEK